MSEKKDNWDKFDILFKSLVLGLIPIAIGFAGNQVAQSLQRGELIQKLVESLSQENAQRDIALIALDEAIPPHKKCKVFGIWICQNDVESDPVVRIAEILIKPSLDIALQTGQLPEDLSGDLSVAAKIVKGERRGNEQYYNQTYGASSLNYIREIHLQAISNRQISPSDQERQAQANISQLIAAIQPSPEKRPTIENLNEVRLVYIQYESNEVLAKQIQENLQSVGIAAPGIEKVEGIGQNDVRYANSADREQALALQTYLQGEWSIQFSDPIDLSEAGYRVAPGQFEIWLK